MVTLAFLVTDNQVKGDQQNLYYPHVFMAYLTLHDSMTLGDEYMKDMATSMMEKFQKYWSDFNLTLAIAVVFDPRYKLHFIEWSYKKVYGEINDKFGIVDKLLDATFQEYVNVHDGSSTTSNFVSTSNASKSVEKTSDDTRRFYEVKSKLLVSYLFVIYFYILSLNND